jgi:hypothetical protein
MRHVYPTSEVPHLWAHQSQDEARNPQGNLFFNGPTIYSYRTSWPLARIYKHVKRGVLVLTNANRCSVTTGGHQSAVNQACSHRTSAAVPHVECRYYAGRSIDAQDHELNAAYFQSEIARLSKEAGRVLSVRSVNWRVSEAQQQYTNALDYFTFFGIRRNVPAFPAEIFDAARERAERIETPDPIRDAAKIRERAKREAARSARLDALFAQFYGEREQRIADWHAGAVHSLTAKSAGYYSLSRADRQALQNREEGLPCMLRVSGDQIETSQGARIPVEHAPRIWTLVQACRSSGRAYEKNGHTEYAGPYAIEGVSAEGELTAGCHKIAFAEIERLAVQLGITHG